MAQGLGENLAINIGVNVTGLPQVQQVQTRMTGLNKTIQRSTSQYNANAVATNKWAKGALQQAGYQVGDFAVQITGGTNALQALGQQGSQFLGIFGPFGAVLGAALAIASAVGVAFSKMGEAANGASEDVKSLSAALNDVESAASLTGQKFNEYLTEEFELASEAIQGMVERLNRLRLEGLQASIGKVFEESSDSLTGMRESFDEIESYLGDERGAFQLLGRQRQAEFEDAFGLTSDQFGTFLENIENVKSSANFDDLVESISILESHLNSINARELEDFRDNLVETLDSESVFRRIRESAEDARVEIAELGTTALSAAEAMFLIQKGVLPPQAKEDLRIIDSTYEVIRKLNQEMAQTGDEILDSAKVAELGTTALSAAEAMLLIQKGVLPPQAREDLGIIDSTYEVIRKLNQEMAETGHEIAELGKTALSAAEAMFLIQKGVLPPQAREDLGIIDSTYEVISKLNQEMAQTGDEILDSAKGASDLADELQRAANAVMNIKTSAFSRLEGLQAEVRGRTRGLGDEQIRIMQAARSAELAAKERGVEDAPELAAIASEAASIERQIIAAESALSLFGQTGSGAMSNVANATQGALGIMEGMFDELDAIVENVSKTIEGSLTSGFMSMIDGTKTVKDAFGDMARAIIAELYEVLVVQRLVGSVKEGTGIAGAIGTALGFRASGGQVTGNKPYIVGERGPEMVVPSRNAHVVPNNKMGGGGGPVQVVYQFQGGVTEADLGRALPLLVERTKREVVDAVQRGGSVARVFR